MAAQKIPLTFSHGTDTLGGVCCASFVLFSAQAVGNIV